MRASRLLGLGLTGLLIVALAAPASADHAGANGWPNGPEEDVRDAPPDDPSYDDVEEGAPFSCLEDGAADQQFEWFGFASVCAPLAIYREGPRAGQPMIAGAAIDRAWQVHTGRPDVTVAVLDVGAIWDEEELDTRAFLNSGELPSAVDRDGDGVIEVMDFCADRAARFRCDAADSLVPDANPPDLARGRSEVGNGFLDAQDLIVAFSDGVDDDGNGYIDDISGWDFFDDDNDPHDASSHASASNHGNGRAEEAVGETNNGMGGVGSCPECTVMHVRLWDTFIPDGNNYAAGVLYAADNGAEVVEVAQATFADTPLAKAAHRYAWHNGTLPVVVSSDLNSAHHDFPGNDAHVLWINGHAPDTRGADQVAPTTWFRQANLTQFGMHAHVGIGGDTGSQATGKSSGVVALVSSWARENGSELTPDELKQILTQTAEDVTPLNTIGVGTADPSRVGWDQHFGYGRIDARAALDAVTTGAIPPQAEIESPSWFRLFDPDEEVAISGTVSARGGDAAWVLEVAAGLEPDDGDFVEVATGDTAVVDGPLGTVPAGALRELFPSGFDFSAPPSDPDQFDITFRLRAETPDGTRGEDRRTGYAHEDPALAEGWPLDVGNVAASPRLWDLDADGDLEILLGGSDGVLTAYQHDGSVLWTFRSDPEDTLEAHAAAPGLRAFGVPSSMMLTPAVADLDDDLASDVIAADWDGNVYRLDGRTGTLVWQVGTDPANSAVPLRRRNDARAPGAIGAPTIGDLDGDGKLEVIVGGLDSYLYAWDHTGAPQAGFPVHVTSGTPDDPRTDQDVKIIVSPAVGDLDPSRPGDEIVVPTNEYLPSSGDFFAAFTDAFGMDPSAIAAGFLGAVGTGLTQAVGGPDTLTYAFGGDGTPLDGWPLRLPTVAGDALPLIGPSVQPTIGDLDGDGDLEVFTSAVSGEVVRVGLDGVIEQRYATSGRGALSQASQNLFVPFLEYPSMGDLDGDGVPEALKGAIDAGVLANLVVAGQNVPQSHVLMAWDASGQHLPAFPVETVDWEILTHGAVGSVRPGATAVLSPNGLYTLDAFGIDGAQAPGWPKFTGGWMVVTPATGDLDGDGDIEVVAGTREGYLFVWETDGEAALDDEWWGFHHDERATGTHGTDTRPPSPILDANVDGATLTFTAPGDDWWQGTVASYEVRVAATPIETFADWQGAQVVAVDITPGPARAEVQAVLPDGTPAFVAVVASDDAGNRSALASAGGAPPVVEPEAPLPTTGGGAAALGLVGLAVGRALRRRRRP